MNNNKNEFKPYIPADRIVPEFTVTSILIGIILAVVFGAANAYIGLIVGMTISASIPAAVISMGIIRVLLRRDSILENNMVQTIGSAGESVAAGAIFTLPALFIWAEEGKIDFPSIMTIFLVALFGGILGVCFMVPLRQALIVEEHGTLPFPEGTACAEVLLAGEQGGSKAGSVFAGLGISAAYKFIADGLKFFPSEIGYAFKGFAGSQIGIQVLPSLAGVGFICGPKIASYMLAGGTLSWFVLMPMIALFGGDQILFPASKPISELTPDLLWTNYIKYIGAGAVAAGGIISLIKSFPLIVRTFKQAMASMSRNHAQKKVLRTEQDLPMPILLVIALVIAVAIWLLPVFPVNPLGALIVVVFGFFFATVSSRMVGLIGSSNNPVSGMAIATLIIATLLLKATGTTGTTGMVGAIAIGGIICIIAAIAGDTSQDLKTGFIVGATPKKQQLGEMIGVVASSIAIGFVLYLLNAAWEYGSDKLPAAQATMMKMLVEGIMNAELPWAMILIGVFIAIAVEILKIPVMPFAVGLYLPFSLSAGIMAGGIIRFIVDRIKGSDEEKKARADRGTLFTSGLIAGEGIVGIILAILAVAGVDDAVGSFLPFKLPQIGSLIIFLILLFGIYKVCMKKEKNK
ncbi:oligopeptide transporter, OPT family [Lachnoclostridium sp. An169]|uniref:OPT family oligopeptide transporter n=1 Tax=Lachnoclostridium sp. An169 TaxID=1965569 RepID=UPI000B39DA83|nr:oligopeptide transporter, OPT family [Lachnoclostridium sp. An169]OUP85688.1 oligopeptide transporter, OPT family [Lachnoclostridium sp. An169]HJA67297.1 oligopeptide transporter, OPT family [Candidatus Mediterraneibacter cottocaccae]